MGTLNSAILIVERENDLTPHEQAIRDRLGLVLGYDVKLQSPDRDVVCATHTGTPVGQATEATLVVVCSRHVSGDLRELNLPVLVCNPFALFDLGMTMGRPRFDFGTQPYSTVFIGPDAIGDQSAIMGRRQVTDDQAPQGWAKPGAKALVVATVGGDASKAVAFAYDKGDAMPGLDAIHRRGAFLATGDGTGQLKADGWRLFDVMSKGVAEGRRWEEHPGPAGMWFLKDGTPTRSLSAEEYRDWVQDKIVAQVWKQLAKTASIYGITGLTPIVLGLYWAISSYISHEVNTKVADQAAKIEQRFDERAKTVKTELTAQNASHTADLVFNDESPLADAVKKRLKTLAQEQLVYFLQKDPDTKTKLVNAATEGLAEVTAKDLLARFADPQSKDNAAKRKLTLQLVFVYGTEAHRQALRDASMKAIVDEKEHPLIRVAALEIHQPLGKDHFQEDERDLKQIIELFEKRLHSQDMMKAYSAFLSSFSDDHVPSALKWVRDNSRGPKSLNAVHSLSGIAKMRPRSGQTLAALKHFQDLALDPNEENKLWGIEGLKQLTKDNNKLAVSTEARQEVLMKLLIRVNDPGNEDDTFILDKDGVSSTILAGLLRPDEDAAFIKGLIGSGPRSESKALQAVLYNWVSRLEREAKKQIPGDILSEIYGVSDVFAGIGTARVVVHALKNGDHKDAQVFLKSFPKLDQSPPPKLAKSPWNKAIALQAAIEADAGSDPPFHGTVTLLNSTCDDKLHGPEIKGQIKTALEHYSTAYGRKLTDLSLLRNVLIVAGADEKSIVHEVFAPALIGAYANVIKQSEYTHNWKAALDVYAKVIEHDPGNPEWPFGRGKLLFDKLRMRTAAIEDLDMAIALSKKAGTEKYEYYDKRAELYRNTPGKIKAALADYERALTLLGRANAKEYQDRAKLYKLHHKMALAQILDDNAEQASEQIQKALTFTTSPLQKAETSENKGLLFLRRGKWKEAFDNTIDVEKVYRFTAWNWIIRYIAAKERGEDKEAARAYRTWLDLRLPNNLAQLHEFIPELLYEHLNVIEPVERKRLQADSIVPGFKEKKVAALHLLKMEAGKRYIIDMESLVFDSYLILQDPTGSKVLQRNDDGGGGLNARLDFVPKESGTYRIIATTLGGVSQGAYALIVRELPEEEE
jgi:tetratricopeptide (TPR) repeat protein